MPLAVGFWSIVRRSRSIPQDERDGELEASASRREKDFLHASCMAIMAPDEIDNTDKGIIYLLQQDARKRTVADIGEQVGVASSTVTNRIDRLEEQGVIKGYHTIVDYTEAGLGHHLLVTATVPISEKEELTDEIMEVSGIVSVRELLTNNENLSLELVGRTQEDIEESLEDLDSLGVDIERMEIMKQEQAQSYNHFGQEFADEEDVE